MFSSAETYCKTENWTKNQSSNETPLFFPSDLIETPRPILSLVDLYDLFQKSTNVTEDKFNHDHDHGIDVVHYSACNRTHDDKYWVEFAVCVTKNGYKSPDVDAQNVPTRIELKIYSTPIIY